MSHGPNGPRSASVRTWDVAGVQIASVTGSVDAATAPLLSAELTALASAELRDLVVDASGASVLSTAGVRALRDTADVLARTGCRLRIVAGTAGRQALVMLPAADALDVYDTVEVAVAAGAAARRAPGTRAGETADAVRVLAEEIKDLRAKLASRPTIARALGMIQERYRLDRPDAAYQLLKGCSQDHNVKLRELATELLAQPRPDRGRPWPHRPPAPRLTFTERGGTGETIAQATRALAAEMTAGLPSLGSQIWLAGARGLLLIAHHGLADSFARALAADRYGHGAVAAAFDGRHTVIVTDPQNDPLYDEGRVRDAYARSDITEIMAEPLSAPDGEPLGVVALHTSRPGGLTAHDGELRPRWQDAVDQTGAWLAWHRHDVLLAGLKQLHRNGAIL